MPKAIFNYRGSSAPTPNVPSGKVYKIRDENEGNKVVMTMWAEEGGIILLGNEDQEFTIITQAQCRERAKFLKLMCSKALQHKDGADQYAKHQYRKYKTYMDAFDAVLRDAKDQGDPQNSEVLMEKWKRRGKCRPVNPNDFKPKNQQSGLWIPPGT